MNRISPKHRCILAIAPSTKGFGFVVLEGQETLVDWGVKTVKGNKNAQSLAKVKKLITQYQPGILILEDVSANGSRRSPRIRKLTQQIVKMAGTLKVSTKLFSRGQVIKTFFADVTRMCFRRYFDTAELILSAQWCLAELKPYPECAELQKFIENGIDVANKLAKEPDCCMIHSDIDQNNLLHDTENISLIDWDDTTYGHPALDLAITVRNLCLKRILRTPDADSIDLAAAARALNRGYGPFPSRIGLGEWVVHACHRYLVLMLYNSLRNPSYPSRERNNIELIEMAESAKLILNSACMR